MGEPLTSTEVKNSTEFLRLQDQYKGEIVEDKHVLPKQLNWLPNNT